MNWFAILPFVLTIAVAENARQQNVGNPLARLSLVCLVTAAVTLFSYCGVRQLVREQRSSGEIPSTFATSTILWFERIRWSLWYVATAIIIAAAQWTRVVQFDWQLRHVPLIDDLLILAPLLGSLVGGWALSAPVDPSNIHATRIRYALARLRDELGLALIPIAVVIVASDAGALIVRWTGIAPVRWLAYVVGLSLIVVALPRILLSLWRTSDLAEGVLKARLENWASQLDVRFSTIRIWHTGMQMANAAVVGMVPRWRHILLTDELVQRLTPREIEAVVLHEMAHIVRRHALWRSLALFPPIALWLLVQDFWHGLLELGQHRLPMLGFTIPLSILLTAGFVAYSFAALAFISRLLEHDADLFATRALSTGRTPAGDEAAKTDLVLALKKLDSHAGRRSNRRSWLHPSMNRRIAWLKLASMRPAYDKQFQQRVRLTCACLTLCPLATATIMLARELLR